MKREELIRLVGAAATALGYTFHTGEGHLAGGTVRSYPAVWLIPPVVGSHSGRREGETTMRLVLHLMALPFAAPAPGAATGTTPAATTSGAAAPETSWQILQRDALQIARSLAEDPAVCSVEGISCTPARQSLTSHGESSVTLTCDVTMWYYL